MKLSGVTFFVGVNIYMGYLFCFAWLSLMGLWGGGARVISVNVAEFFAAALLGCACGGCCCWGRDPSGLGY